MSNNITFPIESKFRTNAYAGLYIITFPGTEAFYVGSSVDVPQRERGHRSAFRAGRQPKRLQEAYEAAGGRWTFTPISQAFECLEQLRAAESALLDIMWDAEGRLNHHRAVPLCPQHEVEDWQRERMSLDRTLEWRDRESNYRGGQPR